MEPPAAEPNAERNTPPRCRGPRGALCHPHLCTTTCVPRRVDERATGVAALLDGHSGETDEAGGRGLGGGWSKARRGRAHVARDRPSLLAGARTPACHCVGGGARSGPPAHPTTPLALPVHRTSGDLTLRLCPYKGDGGSWRLAFPPSPPLPLPFFHDTNGARETATCATDRGEAGRADTASTHPRRPPSEAAASPADCRARHAHKCATVSKPGGGGGKGRCARPRRRGGLRARVPARDVARGPWAPEASIG